MGWPGAVKYTVPGVRDALVGSDGRPAVLLGSGRTAVLPAPADATEEAVRAALKISADARVSSGTQAAREMLLVAPGLVASRGELVFASAEGAVEGALGAGHAGPVVAVAHSGGRAGLVTACESRVIGWACKGDKVRGGSRFFFVRFDCWFV
jgi:hypothetical protein